MKRLSILPLLLLIFAACTHIDYVRRLAVADSLLYIRPDSALTLLRSIPPSRLDTEEERMRYALLTVEAECRNRIPQRDDSLLRMLATYYQKHGDESMQARAFYALGIVNNDLKRENAAMTAFLLSEKYARMAGNSKLLGRIYGNMGYLYQTNDMEVEADSMYHLAEQMARQAQDTAMLAEALTRQSMHLMERGKAYYQQAKRLLLEAYLINYGTDSKKKIIAMSLSQLYRLLQQPDSTIFYARRAVRLCRIDTSDLRRAQYFLGNAFYQCGQIDSASFYFKQCVHSPSPVIKHAAFSQLSKIAKKEENWKQAMEYQEWAAHYQQESRRNVQKEEIMAVHKNYEINQALTLLQRYRIYLGWCIGVLIVLLPSGIIILIRLRKKRYVVLYQEVREELVSPRLLLPSAVETEMIENISVEEIFTEEKNIGQEKNSEEVFEHFSRSIRATASYRKMEQIIQYQHEHFGKRPMESFDEMDQKAFLEEIKCLIPGYTERLQTSYPLLNSKDIFTLCLCLAGMAIPEIACVMNRTRDAIYKKLRTIRKQKMGLPDTEDNITMLRQACKKV